jgi:hypothetical protein
VKPITLNTQQKNSKRQRKTLWLWLPVRRGVFGHKLAGFAGFASLAVAALVCVTSVSPDFSLFFLLSDGEGFFLGSNL